MRKISAWRLILEIIGAALAVAGMVCLVIAYWDRLAARVRLICANCKGPEIGDFADELLYE